MTFVPIATGLARVPAQGLAGRRVDRPDALPRHRTRSSAVGAEGVVEPALVATDVDRCAGDRHRVQGVTAGVVDPRRAVRVRDRGLEARGRVADVAADARRRRRDVAGGRDDEVGPGRAEVDVAQLRGQRRRPTGVRQGQVVPRGEGRRRGAEVGHEGSPASLSRDGGEVADRDQLGAVGADGEPVDLRRAGAVGLDRAGDVEVDVARVAPGVGIQRHQALLEGPSHDQPPAHVVEVVDEPGDALRDPAGVDLRRRRVHPVADETRGDPVGVLERATHVQVRRDVQRPPHLAVDVRCPVADGARGRVEGEEVVAHERRRPRRVLHVVELPAGVHRRPDQGERVDRGVGHDRVVDRVRRAGRRCRRHHRGLCGVTPATVRRTGRRGCGRGSDRPCEPDASCLNGLMNRPPGPRECFDGSTSSAEGARMSSHPGRRPPRFVLGPAGAPA